MDTIITQNNLPELPGGKFILINHNAVTDSATRNGAFCYFRLSQLDQHPYSAKVVWESSSGTLSRKFNKVYYFTYRVDKNNYQLTSTGWIGGLAGSMHYSGLRVQ